MQYSIVIFPHVWKSKGEEMKNVPDVVVDRGIVSVPTFGNQAIPVLIRHVIPSYAQSN